jgi:hypothetical protein
MTPITAALRRFKPKMQQLSHANMSASQLKTKDLEYDQARPRCGSERS